MNPPDIKESAGSREGWGSFAASIPDLDWGNPEAVARYHRAYQDRLDPSRIERRRQRKRDSSWPVEQELLLGTDTDRAVAESLGKTERAVWKKRRKLGIPPYRLGSRTRGRILDNGYVTVRVYPGDDLFAMARADGYVLEHRLVMARHIGRPLLRDESVHHRNGVKDDNSLDNLELWIRTHPDGQRVHEIFEWCLDFIQRYAEEIDRL